MPRRPTGTAYEKRGRIYIGIRIKDGSKWTHPWDGGKAGDPIDLRRAKAAAAELQRQYNEEVARSASVDIAMQTEKRGSPHTLVCTKTVARCEQRVKQRAADEEALAALNSI